MATLDDLKAAFAGESQANRRYLAFAIKAEEEGYKQVAKLFRAAAEAETVHALNHMRIAWGIHSTADNIKEAIAGETHEFMKMYPQMIENAKAEGNKQALRSFELANKVEQTHSNLFEKALSNLGSNEEVDYYVCQVCGDTVEKTAPNACRVCGAPSDKFKKIC
ncbi:MAG: rubrerythrin family protein [wastewater metagenome]|nr:rubrerythrin family protein [Candidatus Loosdrechtia aerotolerans]